MRTLIDSLGAEYVKAAVPPTTWAGRLVRLGRVTVEREINEEYHTDGNKAYLESHFIHHPFKSFVYQLQCPEISHPVLNPFKIGNSYTPRICKNIRNNQNSLILKNRIRFGGGWTVSAFGNYPAFQSLSIMRSNLVFFCRRYKYITFQFKQLFVCNYFSIRIT